VSLQAVREGSRPLLPPENALSRLVMAMTASELLRLPFFILSLYHARVDALSSCTTVRRPHLFCGRCSIFSDRGALGVRRLQRPTPRSDAVEATPMASRVRDSQRTPAHRSKAYRLSLCLLGLSVEMHDDPRSRYCALGAEKGRQRALTRLDALLPSLPRPAIPVLLRRLLEHPLDICGHSSRISISVSIQMHRCDSAGARE
jgi:hypothetical protein